MTTTRAEISKWFDMGVEGTGLCASGTATHMIVVVDEYDWEDYPVYVHGTDHLRLKEAEIEAASMQRVMEVYNLSMDKEVQLNEHRAFNR